MYNEELIDFPTEKCYFLLAVCLIWRRRRGGAARRVNARLQILELPAVGQDGPFG